MYLSDCKTYTQARRLQYIGAAGEYKTEQILYEINLCSNLDLLTGNITEFLLARQPKTNSQTRDEEEEDDDDSAVLCYAAIIKTTDRSSVESVTTRMSSQLWMGVRAHHRVRYCREVKKKKQKLA
jgi:hypothetical protein